MGRGTLGVEERARAQVLAEAYFALGVDRREEYVRTVSYIAATGTFLEFCLVCMGVVLPVDDSVSARVGVRMEELRAARNAGVDHGSFLLREEANPPEGQIQ